MLSGDRETARVLADSDEMIDMLYREIETLTQSQLVDGSSGLEEMRYLVAVLRMLPELERSGDLAQHVASRAVRGLGTEMSHRARGLVERMGELCSEMWRLTADAYADRSAEHADEVEDLDDDLDHLHVILTAEIASGSMSLPVTIESALVARFYERFGDHAVNLTRRIATPWWLPRLRSRSTDSELRSTGRVSSRDRRAADARRRAPRASPRSAPR